MAVLAKMAKMTQKPKGLMQTVGLAWKSTMRDRAENSYYCSVVCVLLVVGGALCTRSCQHHHHTPHTTENPRVRKSGVMDGGVRSSVLGGELW